MFAILDPGGDYLIDRMKKLWSAFKRAVAVGLMALLWVFVSEFGMIVVGIQSTHLGDQAAMLVSNFAELIAIVFMLAVYRKRRWLLPFGRAHARRDIALGALIGLGMFAGVWLVLWALGGYTVQWLGFWRHLPLLLVFLASFACQSTLEEAICRGYIMGHWLHRGQVKRAVIYNALFFTWLHTANPGFDWQAGLGIFFFGVFASLLRYWSGSLWLSAAAHTLWNFAEGCLFGTSVSGLSNIAVAMRSWPTSASRWFGGTFGVERSLPSIVLYLIAIGIMLAILRRRGPRASVENDF